VSVRQGQPNTRSRQLATYRALATAHRKVAMAIIRSETYVKGADSFTLLESGPNEWHLQNSDGSMSAPIPATICAAMVDSAIALGYLLDSGFVELGGCD
jgi:rhodanese-related sulfurtransferase